MFVAAFLRSHGSIKEMEQMFGVSYPTIKARLARIAASLEFIDESPAPARTEVLDAPGARRDHRRSRDRGAGGRAMSGGMSMFQTELRSAVRDVRETPATQAAQSPDISPGRAAHARVQLRPRVRPAKRTVVRLWLPLTPLWLILAPFALLLAPLVLLAPRLIPNRPAHERCAPPWPCTPTGPRSPSAAR